MRIAFVSNFLNHHSQYLSEALIKLSDRFMFVATEAVKNEGFQTAKNESYVYSYYDDKDKSDIEAFLMSADIAIIGMCPEELLIKRVNTGKLTYLYSERYFKKGLLYGLIPQIRKEFLGRFGLLRTADNVYVLSSSAFLSGELKRYKLPVEKCYKWGYFPQTMKYDIEEIISKKRRGSIVWVARFIDWKHPEVCIDLAKKMLLDGINDFDIDMIGSGTMLNQIKERIVSENLENHISLLGGMTPEEVRKHMEDSEILIFTSDRKEGWGAVLNEAMNSGCAVVASSDIGSVPYLIKDRENGFIYQNGNLNDLYKKVKTLYIDADKRRSFRASAYHTIVDLWNANVAAKRLLLLSNDLEKIGISNSFSTGPCSKSEILKDGWYKE